MKTPCPSRPQTIFESGIPPLHPPATRFRSAGWAVWHCDHVRLMLSQKFLECAADYTIYAPGPVLFLLAVVATWALSIWWKR